MTNIKKQKLIEDLKHIYRFKKSALKIFDKNKTENLEEISLQMLQISHRKVTYKNFTFK